MKRFFTSLLLVLIMGFKAFTAPTAYLSYSTFSIPGKGPYLETYLTILGKSISFPKDEAGNYQGTATISIDILLKGKSVAKNAYNLLSQPTKDSLNRPNFIDIQRFPLANGTYDVEITVSDPKSTDKPVTVKEKVTVNYPENTPALSGLQLLESYTKSASPSILTKSGYDLMPYNSDFFPENMEKISFYAELYNSGTAVAAEDKFLLESYIRSYESKRKMSAFGRFSKESPMPVNVVLSEFDIKELPSGNYELVIEMRDKTNKLICSTRKFFQRRNPSVQLSLNDLETVATENTFVDKMNNKDTLKEFVRCLRPISDKNEITHAENIIKAGNTDMMKRFILTFWQKRNNLAPEEEWKNYYVQVLAVNKAFGSQIEKGYLTDRGRVYLQYGSPDSRQQYLHESSSYPYEIWQYNKVKKQTNRRFVFFDPELVNDYRLLHSDALGETYEPRWQIRLRAKDHVDPNLDNNKAPGIYGNNPDDNFNNPK